MANAEPAGGDVAHGRARTPRIARVGETELTLEGLPDENGPKTYLLPPSGGSVRPPHDAKLEVKPNGNVVVSWTDWDSPLGPPTTYKQTYGTFRGAAGTAPVNALLSSREDPYQRPDSLRPTRDFIGRDWTHKQYRVERGAEGEAPRVVVASTTTQRSEHAYPGADDLGLTSVSHRADRSRHSRTQNGVTTVDTVRIHPLAADRQGPPVEHLTRTVKSADFVVHSRMPRGTSYDFSRPERVRSERPGFRGHPPFPGQSGALPHTSVVYSRRTGTVQNVDRAPRGHYLLPTTLPRRP